MNEWHRSDEFEMPLWVRDLDDHLYSVDHRRLCVWLDELEGFWRWEIQTYEHQGIAASGSSDSELSAKVQAVAAARRLHLGAGHGGAA